jgi:uncharacterized protein YjiK
MRNIFLLLFLSTSTSLMAQPAQTDYTIINVPLPADLNKQVCISGMKYLDNKLYMASERCPVIIVADPATGNVLDKINIQVPGNFEMEGLTSFKNKLYLVSENVAAVYEVNPADGSLRTVTTSTPLPPKSKGGDGMEGIAANEKNQKFYLLRERNEDMTKSQLLTFSVVIKPGTDNTELQYESTIELPLENPQWRYSDICYDPVGDRLICLKSFSKGKLRKQFIEFIRIDSSGKLQVESLQNIPVENFSEISNRYKDEDYSMNLEGITIDETGNIYIVSDNTSGKAACELEAKEKTILLQLKKK